MIGRTLRQPLFGLAAMGLITLGGVALASTKAERADCPGKITCPRTGELVCRDRCPTADANRADCPGRIVCPITGELVCKDRCPVGEPAALTVKADSLPPCCRAQGPAAE